MTIAMRIMNVDVLICGAGITGLTLARLVADAGLQVIVVDRRNHIGGNCYDSRDEHGVLVHSYGPHYFRTDSEKVYKFLSRFTRWIDGDYEVRALVDGFFYPIPINLTTLEMLYRVKLDQVTGRKLLDKIRLHEITHPQNSEEFVLAKAGKLIYEKFYKNYTMKQWGIPASALDPSVCGRIPIRLNRNTSYVDARFKVMPEHGYTSMFKAMMDHPLIDFLLEKHFREVDRVIKRKVTVFTGAIDEYFGYCLGRLPYSSLRFEKVFFDTDYVQPCVQVNYPNDFDYTRSVEYKHVTKQNVAGTSVIYEYRSSDGEPYYPIPGPASREIFGKYNVLARARCSPNVIFCGRMAEYRYLNMDQSVESAMRAFGQVKRILLK